LGTPIIKLAQSLRDSFKHAKIKFFILNKPYEFR